MKKSTFGLLVVTLFIASCASGPNLREDGQPEIPVVPSVKQCSASPRDAIGTFFTAIKEMNLFLLRSILLEDDSVWTIFDKTKNEKIGQEVINRIIANPKFAEGGKSCVCRPLWIKDTANPHEKIVGVGRYVTDAEGELFDYEWDFRVFLGDGNCILHAKPIGPNWKEKNK